MVGVVEEVINNGKGKGSGLRIAGHKYGVYDPSDAGLDTIATGTTVSFRYKEKDGGGGITYKNIQGIITTMKDGAIVTPTPAPAAASGGKGNFRKNGEEGGFPLHARCYERALDRRNALQCATQMLPNASAEDVLALARKFEEYTTGDDIIIAEQALEFSKEVGDE